MKKLFSILLLVCLTVTGIQSKAQVATTALISATSNVLDTVTSSTAHYMRTGVIKGLNRVTVVTAKALEISGTTAGTLSLEASINGTDWYPYYASKDSVYTLTLADVGTAQNYRWEIKDFGDNYLRVKAVGVSTVNYTISGSYQARKYY